MVKAVKKSFKSGLDAIIQNTAVSEEPETIIDVKEKRITDVKEKEKQITITIPVSLKKDIKKYCANNEITIKELFINSVNRYMKED